MIEYNRNPIELLAARNIIYMSRAHNVESSSDDGEFGLRNSPLRLNPGERVELKTFDTCISTSYWTTIRYTPTTS